MGDGYDDLELASFMSTSKGYMGEYVVLFFFVCFILFSKFLFLFNHSTGKGLDWGCQRSHIIASLSL